MGTGQKPVPQVPKKTPKNGSRHGWGLALYGEKIVIYMGKRVVGGTGLEPVTKAL